ncbi:ABC transporter substrate-binding protein [Microvirga yunnanensis]|uniref:ABC transporter substrate-binding protein n=1 Tax=Microvirga yunnanensis TaxID=2953740 RepID=UPI0021C71B3C|nr:ABC transporter substrate-binding protein [Microvirga sp. HBU65207]
MLRRAFFRCVASVGALAMVGLGSAGAQEPPRLRPKEHYTVGFSQPGSASPWRRAQLDSIRAEAIKRGDQLIYTDAGGSADKQVADVNALIAQGVDLIFLAPRDEKLLIPAVMAAKSAGIPVILLDRTVNPSLAQAGRDYVTFIGSDFVEQGRRTAEALTKATNGNARIVQLEGLPGSSPANGRRKGFEDFIQAHRDMTLVASQPADFERAKGQQVTEALLRVHPDASAIFAHNDEMAIGAMTALEAVGRTPGKDVIVVSVDGTRTALQAIIDGKLLATVETNPRFGPVAFATMARYARGEPIEPWVVITDRFFDKTNAAQFLDSAY